MQGPSPEMVELFLQEASEHLQFLREYSGILQDPYPLYEDIERLYISAHGVAGTGGTYGYAQFHEVAGKLAHIYQYAMNASISQQATGPLVEFIYEAIAVLESDLLMISAKGEEAMDEIASFKQRYPFAFQVPPPSMDDPTEQPHPPEPEPDELVEAEQQPEPETQTPVVEEPVAEAPVAQATSAAAEPESSAPETFTQEPAWVAEEAAHTEEHAPLESADFVEEVLPEPLLSLNEPLTQETEPLTQEAEPVVQEPEPVAAEAMQAEPLAMENAAAPQAATPEEPAAEILEIPALEAAPPLDDLPAPESEAAVIAPAVETRQRLKAEDVPLLAGDEPLPEEVLEFFVPEIEEHLQSVTHCLLSLETSPSQDVIHELFRAVHTVKGSAAQVGAQRIATIAHRAEDLIGKLREGTLQPTSPVIDVCLDSVDVLKRTLYRQWPDDASFQQAARSLIARLENAAEFGAEALAPVTVPPPTAEPAEITPPPVAPVAPVVEPVLEAQPEAAPEIPQPAAEPPIAAGEEPVLQVPLEEAPQETEEPQAATAAPSGAVAPAAPAEKIPGKLSPSPAPVAAEPVAPPVETPVAGAEEIAAAFAAPEPRKSAPELAEELSPEHSAALAQRMPVGMAQSKSVRIALERLDRMMNAVGELVINRTRMLGRIAELSKLAEVLNFSKGRMSDKVTEFQEKYEFSRIGATPLMPSVQLQGAGIEAAGYTGSMYGGATGFGGFNAPPAFGSPLPFSTPPPSSSYSNYGGTEFSELEMDRYDDFGILSRSLTEISADISEVLSQLDGFVRRVDGDIDEFTKLAHRLQDEITQARMVPIGNLFTRIERTARDAAKASNKQVELSLAGAETELDNNIIQHLADPLLHLVRNAVAHGIEDEMERYEAGKPDRGNVSVRAYHKGNHIYVEVEDDGRGVDFDRVKQTAIASGIITEEDALTMERRALVDLLFRPGFSTSTRRTELAGRGVGLDVVKSNVSSLNGEIEVETEKGIGTRFTLKVPLTLIISQALFVQCGEQVFAFPLAFVEEIRRIRPEEIEEVGGKLIAKVRDVLTEVVRFDDALQLPALQPINGYLRLVLVNVAGRQVGIVVEEVLRKDEIVIKSLGEYLHGVKLFPGATIAPDGSLILMVDVNRLIMGESVERRPLSLLQTASRLFLPGAEAVAHGGIPDAAMDRVEREKLVVLADDSISVRKFVGRMLEKAGYRVKLASDGLEALEIATAAPCDLVITDLEMPRTNGYELMMHLRQTPSTAKVPVMVVTSRAGAKHREQAMKEGARAFMVKPVQEESFIAQVVELIGTSGQATPAGSTVQ